MSNPILPASQTKHLSTLLHPLPRDPTTLLNIRQISASTPSSIGSSACEGLIGSTERTGRSAWVTTGTTGSTLWLGAQIMACYLFSLPLPPSATAPTPALLSPSSPNDGSRSTSRANEDKRKVLELGSGVGYLALCLSVLGYDVIASDLEPVSSNVLQPNIIDGLGVINRRGPRAIESGQVQAILLDWEGEVPEAVLAAAQGQEISMIVSTDTIYHLPLVHPFFRTIACISERMRVPPIVLLAIERRDGKMIDSALEIGRSMGIELRKVGKGRVDKAVEKAGWGWKAGVGWEGVEIWRGRWKRVDQGHPDTMKMT